MEQDKGYILRVEGYDRRYLKPDVLTTSKPFINDHPFESLKSALASAIAVPLGWFDNELCAQQGHPYQLFRISIQRNDDIRPLIVIRSSRHSKNHKGLGLHGIYLSTGKPAFVDQQLRMNLSGLLYQPDKSGIYLLAYRAQVRKHYDLSNLAGFTKLLGELQPHIHPLQFGQQRQGVALSLRRLPTHPALQSQPPSIKKTFGP